MAFWPFGRRKKKNIQSGEDIMVESKGKESEPTKGDMGRSAVDVNAPTMNQNSSRRQAQRTSHKLTKSRTRTPDSQRIESAAVTPAQPQRRTRTQENYNEKAAGQDDLELPIQRLSEVANSRGDIPSYYFQNPLSQSSIQPEKFSVVHNPPTLRPNRHTYDSSLPRVKSSKRKAEEREREQEIRAMSSSIPIPKRPASTGAVPTYDNRSTPSRTNRKQERPNSEVSLPIEDSMHSTTSATSDGHNYKVSAFDALSPRPTIKYTENPRYGSRQRSTQPSRASTRKETPIPIPEGDFNSKDRMDDLANDLDAAALRELMERDRRRREKRRKSEQEKAQRRLQRRAERQRIEEAKQMQQSPQATENEVAGLGIAAEPPQEPYDSPFNDPGRRKEVQSPESWLQDPSKENLPMLEDPFKDPMGESRLEDATPPDEREDPILEIAKEVRLSQASMSPPTSPKPYTQGSHLGMLSDLASRSQSEIPNPPPQETQRDLSPPSRIAGGWTSFFRRTGARAKRDPPEQGRGTPSEFSNASRESMAKQPPSAFARNVRPVSGTPTRTQSKFREDLPELPISPPASRVQSPEIISRSAQDDGMVTTSSEEVVPSGFTRPLSDIHPAFREEIALSRNESLRNASPDPALLSQSLASVDSEGSWLSGRPPKRSSQPTNLTRSSVGSLHKRLQELGASEDDIRIAEEEHYRRLTPAPEEALATNESNPDLAAIDKMALRSPLDATTEEGATYHDAVARQPTIIRRTRAKSREGLLTDFQNVQDSSDSSPVGDSPARTSSRYPVTEDSSVYRAMSVDLGKGHARHISAGSARLLDLPPRNSTDLKRLSSGSSPLSGAELQAPDEEPETQS